VEAEQRDRTKSKMMILGQELELLQVPTEIVMVQQLEPWLEVVVAAWMRNRRTDSTAETKRPIDSENNPLEAVAAESIQEYHRMVAAAAVVGGGVAAAELAVDIVHVDTAGIVALKHSVVVAGNWCFYSPP
jgi:hypothetical protein